MSVRWSGVFAFHWAPILTFARRREAALEALERTERVAGYYEDSREFGIAVGRRETRLTVRAHGLDMLLGAPDADAIELRVATREILAAMQPKRLHAVSCRTVYSVDVEGEYDAVRAANAQHLTGLIAGGRTVDFSALVDVRAPDDAELQIEFGIVDDDELRSRLTDFAMGRHPTAAEMPPLRSVPEVLPSTSLFADVMWFTSKTDVYSGEEDVDSMWAYMNSRIERAIEQSAEAASDLAAQISQRGNSGELSRGA